MFPAAVLDAARAHAARAFPAESCGLALRAGRAFKYLPCENLAPDPKTRFEIAPKVVLKAQKSGALAAVIHSHPAPLPACPSEADMRAQVAMGALWGIVPVGEEGDAGEVFFFGDQAPRPWRAAARAGDLEALVGLPYRHGVTDCFSLLRDYYAAVAALDLPEVPRGFTSAGPASETHDYYAELHESYGFAPVELQQAAPGDALLLQIRADHINHAAVLVSAGEMLHHPGGAHAHEPQRLSRREPAARWGEYIARVVRHPALGGAPGRHSRSLLSGNPASSTPSPKRRRKPANANADD